MKTRPLLIIVLMMFCVGMKAQTDMELLMGNGKYKDYYTALDIIAGKTKVNTLEWAVNILEQYKDSLRFRPHALEALGFAYEKGRGTKRDLDKAILYYNAAIEAGNVYTYRNLGLLYHNAPRDRQDFVKSLACYEKAMRMRPDTIVDFPYSAAYMYYKGLGCKQDYKHAMELYKMCAEKKDAASMYMLGLCYRNGFGCERNVTLARQYLEDAAFKHNHRASLSELKKTDPEVITPSLIYERKWDVPLESMPEIKPVKFMVDDVCGEYEGLWLTYDWSGQKLVREKHLTVSMLRSDYGNIVGRWTTEEDTIDVKASIATDGKLTFDDTNVKLRDRYMSNDIRCVFDYFDVVSAGTTLSGKLQLYSLSLREPERPMFVILKKKRM
jgi:tetratricopeptide (TPR) repeat protein